ncbi:MAG: hypothetical protein K2Y39_13650 [Candidatus Obscuribacterales bacterium]|nr:hypothetical protein [Candidatus Obscuribacterales bacterium]
MPIALEERALPVDEFLDEIEKLREQAIAKIMNGDFGRPPFGESTDRVSFSVVAVTRFQ